MMLACELCGQPTVRENPKLCAECYYRYWYWETTGKSAAKHENVVGSTVS